MKIKTSQIIHRLKELGSDEIAEHSLRFFKTGKGEYGEGDIFLGIRVPVLRKEAKKYQTISLEGNIELLKSKYHEARLMALFILVNKYKRAEPKEEKEIVNLYFDHFKYINNWDLVDSSAHLILGPWYMDRNKKKLYQLVRSKDLWERRIAIMTCFYFIKNNQFEDAIKIIELCIKDTHDLIHKACGWMLREIGKREIKVERDFLEQYAQRIPRTMLRYAIEKFPERERKGWLNKK